MAQINILDEPSRSYHKGYATVVPNAQMENDEEAQMFYNLAVMRDQMTRTKLIGAVDSQSFAETDMDYFVGDGVLAGVIGLPSARRKEMIAAADQRWAMLKGKLDLPEAETEGMAPLFCWIDPIHPEIEVSRSHSAWLEIDDVVGPLFAGEGNTKPLYPGIPRAGLAIILKICGALAKMSYSPEVVAKVWGLVATNLVTAVHYESPPLQVESSRQDKDWIRRRLRILLRSLLDPKENRIRSVNMNTNEPVLLINSFGELHHEQIRDIVRETADQLQKDWNIWPVRVYAGPFIVGDMDEERRRSGFSITLLNVCNTDIGGPSMIDLLDAACDAPVWSFSLSSFFKETWRDRHLIDKSDTGAAVSRSSSPDSLARRSEESRISEEPATQLTGVHDESEDDREPDQEGPSEISHAGVGFTVVSRFTTGQSAGSPPEDSIPGDDNSAWHDVRTHYGARSDDRRIEHPTWEHTAVGDSLLDLVRSHAAALGHGADSEEPKEPETQKETSQRPKSTGTDDDFVVV